MESLLHGSPCVPLLRAKCAPPHVRVLEFTPKGLGGGGQALGVLMSERSPCEENQCPVPEAPEGSLATCGLGEAPPAHTGSLAAVLASRAVGESCLRFGHSRRDRDTCPPLPPLTEFPVSELIGASVHFLRTLSGRLLRARLCFRFWERHGRQNRPIVSPPGAYLLELSEV